MSPVALLSISFALACGPSFLVVPGGELRGTLASAGIDDWGFTDTVRRVQLETRPEDPYSVHIYGVSSGDAFYVASESWRQLFRGSGGDARWVSHIAADPRVRLRVDKSLYELKAVRVQDEEELRRVRGLFQKKYGTDPEGWEEPPWVYRLEAR